MKKVWLAVLCSAVFVGLGLGQESQPFHASTDFWWMDINYRPAESRSLDGDAYLWRQRLDFPLNESFNLAVSMGLGKEDYDNGHTDIYHGRLDFTRQWNAAHLGLGVSFWHNDYSLGGDHQEWGPTVLAGVAAADLLGEALRVDGGIDLLWMPFDLGDAEEFEHVEVELSLSRAFKRVDLEVGYRVKHYYESSDHYLYQGPFAAATIDF